MPIEINIELFLKVIISRIFNRNVRLYPKVESVIWKMQRLII